MVIEIPRRDFGKPYEENQTLTWNYIYLTELKIMSATVICSNGHWAGIERHKIADDGTVTPSVVCTRCDFHEMIKLVGWDKDHEYRGT